MKNLLYLFLALTFFACGNATPNAEATPAATTNTVVDRDVNIVKVEFDPNVVKESDMTNIVNTIADGQYHVVKAEIISHKAS